MTSSGIPPTLSKVSALVFDVIGTLLNWHEPVSTALQAHASRYPSLALKDLSFWQNFAHEWNLVRSGVLQDEGEKGIYTPVSELYAIRLKELMKKEGIIEWDENEQRDLVKTWEMMEAWSDTVPGLDALSKKYTLCALTNGTTPFLIASNKRNGMAFDLVLTSSITGQYKPNPQPYQIALKALQIPHEEIAMVAAHAFDLEAGAEHTGFRTIYITRPTDDRGGDPARVAKFDLVIGEGGIAELARRLGAA